MYTSDFAAGELQPELKSLFFSWHSALEDSRFPKLTDFGLPNTQIALDVLSIYEIERSETGAPADFKALYARTRTSNTLRNKYVGTRLSDHAGFGPGSMMWSCFCEVAANPRPLLVSLPYTGPLPDYQSTSEIYLPLRGEQGSADYVLVGVVLLQEEYSGPGKAGSSPGAG
ncbi:hypothetical protein [Leisingera sp. ANG-Vp]|uniref:hypothetical protein n=1 Tax=Leisingera sp. ANG-Vp TaxID=1577896 RepID=UPI00057F8CD9|nr:hypothetical protein [Leisingera sp. ANG-Vp]KIC21471.1 hypothetical protein RA20_03755 [Leisingera sp. ANG-Vp]